MFEALSDKLKKVLKDLRGQGRLAESHIEAAMREIRIALLEADVNFKVVKSFVDRVKEKALGQEVMGSLSPAQQVVKVVYDEMVEMLGGTSTQLLFTKRIPNVVMIVGLQGSGKTTTTGKLARLLVETQKRRPLLLSVDVYRPAARQQLSIIGQAIGQPVFDAPAVNDPIELCRQAVRECELTGYDTLLIDTAGRLHIDEELMAELQQIKHATVPSEILFIADAMTGQDAVRSAQEFHEQVGLTGVILTKMEGDTRGGAALSIKEVTGQPIKFLGVGERSETEHEREVVAHAAHRARLPRAGKGSTARRLVNRCGCARSAPTSSRAAAARVRSTWWPMRCVRKAAARSPSRATSATPRRWTPPSRARSTSSGASTSW